MKIYKGEISSRIAGWILVIVLGGLIAAGCSGEFLYGR